MLIDSYNRSFSYLRLSLLPICNFKCVYCLPNGNPMEALHQKHLTHIEIKRLIKALAKLGIKKVRLTGGEPTLRTDLIEIAKSISEIQGIEKIALTTNGYRLNEIAGDLKASGVTALNVSVDSLITERFFEITGQNRLQEVLKGIEKAKSVGMPQVKINAVAMKGLNDDEFENFIEWSQKEDLHVRFIELMTTRDNAAFYSTHHLDLAFLEPLLVDKGYFSVKREADGGPADLWKKPGREGTIGLIRPYKKNFCDSCNRLRVTSEGALQLCLFGNGTLPLRHFLQDDGQEERIQSTVLSALTGKEISHYLHEGNYGSTRNLATMGG